MQRSLLKIVIRISISASSRLQASYHEWNIVLFLVGLDLCIEGFGSRSIIQRRLGTPMYKNPLDALTLPAAVLTVARVIAFKVLALAAAAGSIYIAI